MKVLNPSDHYSQLDLNGWLKLLANRHVNNIQLGLSRIRKVYNYLNLPKVSAKIITVAGTNGKGSVVTLLEDIYVKAGYRVGTYTSPHLYKFNERIRLNKKPISNDSLCKLFFRIEQNRGSNVLTYFEVVTLAALEYFAQQELDVAILEVGMGGRLDAVNIVDTDCAVITTIAYDHQAYLGTTIEAIAAEKAGIIRLGKPTIYSDINLPTSIRSRANQVNSTIYQLGKHFDFQVKGAVTECRVEEEKFQICSAAHPQSCVTAMMVVCRMNDILPVQENDLIKAVNNCYIPGRLEWIAHSPEWLLDVSHNIQAVQRLYQSILERNISGKIRFVFGIFKDKPFEQIIELMAKLSQYWYIAPLDDPRSASTLELISKIGHHTVNYLAFSSVENACERAYFDAEMNDLIVVFGSFVTVQMAKGYLNKMGKD